MKPHEFMNRLDEAGIVSEIAKAEKHTTGEIRVFVSRRAIEDPVARAQSRFEKLGMTRTPHRNGVLIYFAPCSHKFAVVGDTAIHEKCGDKFWEEVTAEIRTHLKTDRFTEAVTHGVRRVGEVLALHFPGESAPHEKLPKRVVGD